MATPPLTAEVPAAGDLLFGRYRVAGEIGRGGMGVVLLALDLELDSEVAVKLVPDLIVRDSEGLEELKREVLRGMALTHPNIVRTHGFERDDRMAAIIMEFVDGGNFIELKRAHPGGCLDTSKLLPWLEQLCPVLDYAHFDIRIAHRDLKPHNLMYSNAGRLKVADFGISSTLNETGTRITLRDASSGTPAYMSPQQVMGDRTSHLDDVYSLGATIYELLTGKPPFYQGQILAQVLDVVPAPMAARREELGVLGKEGIPAIWEETVAACLAKFPGQRPQSAGDVLARLLGALNVASLPVATPPVSIGRKSGSGKRWAAGIVVCAALAGAGFKWVSHRAEEKIDRDPLTEPRPPVPPSISDPSTDVAEVPPVLPAPEAPEIMFPEKLPEAQEGLAYRFSMSAEGGKSPYNWSTDGTVLPDGLVLDDSGLLHGVPTTPSRGGFGVKVAGSDGLSSRRSVTLEIFKKPEPEPMVEAVSEKKVPLPHAEKENPHVNSLGMRFVPAGTPDVLFSIWLTRVNDFKEFAVKAKYDATKNVLSFKPGGLAELARNGDSWKSPGFGQDASKDPVCGVSWDDAVQFCKWLTTEEHQSGKLDEAFEYRLPTVEEWRASLGFAKDLAKPPEYPWGMDWPPPEGRGNLAGDELFIANGLSQWRVIQSDDPRKSFRDATPFTSAVDNEFYRPNDFGIHDFYGNLWQFCEDSTDEAGTRHRMMGGSWLTSSKEQLRIDSSDAMDRPAAGRGTDAGFRCVLSRTR